MKKFNIPTTRIHAERVALFAMNDDALADIVRELDRLEERTTHFPRYIREAISHARQTARRAYADKLIAEAFGDVWNAECEREARADIYADMSVVEIALYSIRPEANAEREAAEREARLYLHEYR